MDGETLRRRAVVLRRSDRLRADERAVLGNPERDLAPAAASDHRNHLEGRADRSGAGNLEMRHAELVGEACAIACVPVDQLDDAGRLTERADAVEHAVVEARDRRARPSRPPRAHASSAA